MSHWLLNALNRRPAYKRVLTISISLVYYCLNIRNIDTSRYAMWTCTTTYVAATLNIDHDAPRARVRWRHARRSNGDACFLVFQNGHYTMDYLHDISVHTRTCPLQPNNFQERVIGPDKHLSNDGLWRWCELHSMETYTAAVRAAIHYVHDTQGWYAYVVHVDVPGLKNNIRNWKAWACYHLRSTALSSL